MARSLGLAFASTVVLIFVIGGMPVDSTLVTGVQIYSEGVAPVVY